MACGFMPTLRQMRDHYGADTGPLPLATRVTRPPPPRESYEPPPFVGGGSAPALDKCRETVKQRWLTKAESEPLLPRLTKTPPKVSISMRTSAEWLAGAGSPKKTHRPKALQALNDSPAATQTAVNPTTADESGAAVTKDDADSPTFPTLLWLIGEDGLEPEAFYRVCDRNFMLLQLQCLLHTLDSMRTSKKNMQQMRKDTTDQTLAAMQKKEGRRRARSGG